MKLHILGCLSGTEPMPGKHHTSWVLETDNGLYWFDAGENCAHTAYLKGLDPRKMKALFISHCHSDHVDGLFLLFCVAGKLQSLHREDPPFIMQVYSASEELVPAILALRKLSEGSNCRLGMEGHHIDKPGLLFDDGNVRVECSPTLHLPQAADGTYQAWSFRITSGGKTIIYSGDVNSYMEFDSFLSQGCDWLLMESGHHSPPALCGQWKAENRRIGNILFVHHGREILRDEELCRQRCSEAWGAPVLISYDGMTIDL